MCEGCGAKITKSEQIRHDTVQCDNPIAKCKFCKKIFHLKELADHVRTCEQRNIVKMEYMDNLEAL